MKLWPTVNDILKIIDMIFIKYSKFIVPRIIQKYKNIMNMFMRK